MCWALEEYHALAWELGNFCGAAGLDLGGWLDISLHQRYGWIVGDIAYCLDAFVHAKPTGAQNWVQNNTNVATPSMEMSSSQD